MNFIELKETLINLNAIETISIGWNSITSKPILYINTNPHKYEFVYETHSSRNEDYNKLKNILMGE